MAKLDKRFILLDPARPNALTASDIYYDSTATIKEKIDTLSGGGGTSIVSIIVPLTDFYFDSEYPGVDTYVFLGMPVVGFSDSTNGLVYTFAYSLVENEGYYVKALYGLNGESDGNVVLNLKIEGIALEDGSLTEISNESYTIEAGTNNKGKMDLFSFTDSNITSSNTSSYRLFRLSLSRDATSAGDTYSGMFNLMSILLIPGA